MKQNNDMLEDQQRATRHCRVFGSDQGPFKSRMATTQTQTVKTAVTSAVSLCVNVFVLKYIFTIICLLLEISIHPSYIYASIFYPSSIHPSIFHPFIHLSIFWTG